MLVNLGMVDPSIPNLQNSLLHSSSTIRYQGFLLIEQHNKSWLVRQERSPLRLLPFRTVICSLSEAKQILDNKLLEIQDAFDAA